MLYLAEQTALFIPTTWPQLLRAIDHMCVFFPVGEALEVKKNHTVIATVTTESVNFGKK